MTDISVVYYIRRTPMDARALPQLDTDVLLVRGVAAAGVATAVTEGINATVDERYGTVAEATDSHKSGPTQAVFGFAEEFCRRLAAMGGLTAPLVYGETFAGWMRRVSVYGLAAAANRIQCGSAAVDHGGNTYRVERTRRDLRVADRDWYCVLFQVAGRSELTQNSHTIQLGVGDIGLVDGARSCTRLSDNGAQWLSIYLPRQAVTSHLGFEPQACLCGRGETLAARVLRQLVLEGTEDEESAAAPAGPHMRLALYDLVGAIFAPSNPGPVSRHADRLFARIRSVINERCVDPNFGPNEVAAETGISLRYLQKLFTDRGWTCSEFIYSLRLDHAASLVHRRASLGARQPLSEIAYSCGFRDYTHFARKFRYRFGHPPGAHSAEPDRAGDLAVRASTGENASRAHDVRAPAIYLPSQHRQ
jgi:AraC-like DNA-binding protein